LRALVRPPSDAYARCLRTDAARVIDVASAREQHAAYCEILRRACAVEVVALAPEPDLPDACFVEDTAVVVGRRVVITRPGAPSRRPETASVERAMPAMYDVRRIERGFIDGGDVLVSGGVAYVGLSSRTDEEGVRQLGRSLEVEVRPVKVRGLHLKSDVTPIGERRLVMRRGAFDAFAGHDIIETDEPLGANVLWVRDRAIVSAAAPKTAELLREAGLEVHVVDVSEFHAGDAGLTCLSVLL